MTISKKIMKEITCCLSNDEHVVIEPIILECGSNACKKCINEINQFSQCYRCNKTHEKEKSLKLPFNKLATVVVETFLPDLFKNLEIELKTVTDSLKGKIV